MSMRRMGSWLKRTYDRIIASVVLLALFVSLILLAVYAQLLKGRQEAFDNELKGLVPKHADAQPVDISRFTSGHQTLNEPMQIGEWTLRLLTPELRVSCVNCERPIPYAATNCSFCKTLQPESTPDVDKDDDGMFDTWETEHGLNPLDPEDANTDADRDGFSNKDEYLFKTDPQAPASHPSALAKVTVETITPIPFDLIFKSISRVAGKALYQINLRKDGRTYFAAVGDAVEGFKIVACDESAPNAPMLTVERNGKTIVLSKGKVVPRSEYEVGLLYAIDGTRIATRVDGEFELKGVKYQVKMVDSNTRRVLIHDPSRDMDVWIGEAAKAPSGTEPKDEGA